MSSDHPPRCRLCAEPAAAQARYCRRCGARLRAEPGAEPDPGRDPVAPEKDDEEPR